MCAAELSSIDFNPPTPHGVGHKKRHLLETLQFQSTHPAWGGTHCPILVTMSTKISIHPPRMGWDEQPGSQDKDLYHFNPPTPHGVGQVSWSNPSSSYPFQSTHPAWGGTDRPIPIDRKSKNFNPPTPHGVGPILDVYGGEYEFISIHPPRMGWDRNLFCYGYGTSYFNPPTPHGVGHIRSSPLKDSSKISIHPPRMGWDSAACTSQRRATSFQSTHPAWGGTP